MVEPDVVEFFFKESDRLHLVVYHDSALDDVDPSISNDFPLEDLYQAFKSRLLRELLNQEDKS